MSMLGTLILALANLLHIVLMAYLIIIIARALISWVSPDPFNPIVRFLYRTTEPVLRPIRRRLPDFQIGLDLSPVVVIIAIQIVDSYIVPELFALGLSLR
jgi:YggT family protein